MSRPIIKAQLIAASEKEYAALEKLLASLTPDQMIRPPALGEWSVKDVLAHLYEWQQMFFHWYQTGLRGEKPAVPAEGYKWSQLPALNQHIYETYRDLPLDDIQHLFRESHKKTITLVESLPETDLFTRGKYAWMNQNMLASYLHANWRALSLGTRRDTKGCKKIMADKTLDWLLEPDSPGVRYLALRDLAGLLVGDPELVAAQKAAYSHGPISVVLANMHPDGYWCQPGPGYTPKCFSTVWSLILLSQLGASAALDERVARACAYLLDRSLTSRGQFTMKGVPSSTIDCLQGNLCAALLVLGCNDPRLEQAFEWMARSVTGEGLAPNSEPDAPLRYYAYKCGPLFACGFNDKFSCGWGAVKVMLAFGKLPRKRRTPIVERAIQQGVDFLLGVDPATAGYSTRAGSKPSRNWWKFGFPVFYVADILQIVEALTALGYGGDPRLANALDLVRQKQDDRGRWALEYDYTGKTWVDFGPKKQPNKWVTLRALRALKEAEK